MIGKGHPKESTLQVRQQKIVQEEWGGALGAAMDGRSESILSRASALRWQSGEGCKWVLRTCVPISSRSPLVPRSCRVSVCPHRREGPVASHGECTFS